MGGHATISIAHLSPDVRNTYALSAMMRIWTDEGYRIHVSDQYATDADACIMHLDLTKLDPQTVPRPPQGAPHINARVLDISKRAYSSLLLERSADWDGPVIIKTDLNNFGISERRRDGRKLFSEMRRRFARLSWRCARALPKRFYPILDSIREVPNWVWDDRYYVVEKFMPERVDDLYCVRGWLFLGSKGYAYRLFSTDPLVKTGSMVRHEFFERAPDDIMEWRERMGFDFGKFDYVERDGRSILLDANRTPSYTGAGDTPRFLNLASGIRDFLP
jgi:hypothetical protein